MSVSKHGDELFTSPLLDHIWGNGDHNAIGNVTFKSAAYIARYIMKKVNGKNARRHYGEIVDRNTGEIKPYRLPEYITMSLKPGIGHDWIQKYMEEVYPRDEIIINGHPVRPPKYYDREYEKVNPEGYVKLIETRHEKGKKHKWNNTPKRLAAREGGKIRSQTHYHRDAV